VADPVKMEEALVTEYRRDNLTNCCGGNATDMTETAYVVATIHFNTKCIPTWLVFHCTIQVML
jgi:hypothetical protein